MDEIFVIWSQENFVLGALNQLTRNLACEWAKDNIRTNSVAPGYTRTPMTQCVSPPVIQNELHVYVLKEIDSGPV